MAEDFIKITGTKSEIYQALIPQIQALVGAESDFTANQANIAAAVKESFDFLVRTEEESIFEQKKNICW